MHVSALFMKLYHVYLFYLRIHFMGPRVQVISVFFMLDFHLNYSYDVITTSKRLHSSPEHSLIYDDCNLILNILLHVN